RAADDRRGGGGQKEKEAVAARSRRACREGNANCYFVARLCPRDVGAGRCVTGARSVGAWYHAGGRMTPRGRPDCAGELGTPGIVTGGRLGLGGWLGGHLHEQVPREELTVFPPEVGPPPILPGDHPAAVRCPTPAGHRLGVAVDRRVVEGQLLSRGHV